MDTWPKQLAVAVIAVAAATVLRWLIFQLIGSRLPYLTFFPAVLTAALLGGWRAGAAATVLSIFPAALWTDRDKSWLALQPAGFIGVTLFILTCAYSVAVAEWMLRARASEAGASAGARRADQRLREFLESISDGFFALDRDWRFTHVNRAAAAITGHDAASLIGRDHWDVFPHPPGGEGAAVLRKAFADRAPGHFEIFYAPHDKWYHVHAYPADAGGISIFFQDITARVRADQAKREADATFRAAVDAGRIGIWDWDIAADKVTWSDRIHELHGLRPGEFAGTVKAFAALVHPDDLPAVQRLMDRAMTDREPYVAEFRTLLPTDEVRWLQTHGRVLFDDAGKPTRLLGAVVDVTGRKRADEDKARVLADERAARSQAEHAGRMKDEFLATLSHELRTPLNAILGWAQLLRRGDADAEDLRMGLDTIERNARAQTQLIEDLLDMSRIIAGKLRLDVQRVDPRAVVEAAAATVAHAADARAIRVEQVLDPRAGPVSGDPARLQQVLWNLLSNAVKFTPKGGRVQVVLARVNSHVEVSVADTGEGIAPEFLPHVFERFRQADASTTRRHGGLGLGLAIVKSLVETHGGSIRAASPGKGLGSTFTVTLPLAVLQPDGGAAGGGDGRPVHPLTPSSPVFDAPDISLAGLKVLVVDDEPDSRALIRRVLEARGATVSDAASADDALRVLPALRPDVLLSDIGMPDVDGYELLARVRKLDGSAGGRTPAVALTAFARSEDRTRALLAGYLVHISKPVEPAELVATIASVAGRTGAAAASAVV